MCLKFKHTYVILISLNEVINLKTKIIAIVIAVVITATGVGVAVKQSNDKHTEELINAAVSQALATTENTTIAESTTETTTKESTTRRSLNAPQPTTTEATITETTTTETTTETTTIGKVVYNTVKAIEPSYEDRHCNQYKRALIDGEKTMVCIIEGNCPDAGRYCYWDKNDKLVYIDDISQIEFVD